jgi:hypothetical protein
MKKIRHVIMLAYLVVSLVFARCETMKTSVGFLEGEPTSVRKINFQQSSCRETEEKTSCSMALLFFDRIHMAPTRRVYRVFFPQGPYVWLRYNEGKCDMQPSGWVRCRDIEFAVRPEATFKETK